MSLKQFIKKYIINEEHPFWRLWQKRIDRIYERHSRMTYAEIETEISKRYKDIASKLCKGFESEDTYDFKRCKCGRVAIDGGHEYARRLFYEKVDYTDLSVLPENETENVD